MLKKFRSLDNWTKAIVLFMWGSVFLGKASGYIGLLLGGVMLLDPKVLWNRWYAGLTHRSDPLSAVSWSILISLLYGFGQVIYGYLLGYPILVALQILIFNICPVYVFLGIWVGARHPGIVRTYIRFMAWFAVVYTPLYFLFLRKVNVSLTGLIPGNNLDLLGSPGSGGGTLVGLLAFEPNLAKFWLPILVLVCLTIANQERSDWMGLAIALVIWGSLTKKMHRVFAMFSVIVAVLLFAFLIDLRLPPIPGRGGEISARETVARLAASVSPELSQSVGGDPVNARFYSGTIYWRTHWWANIREAVSENPSTLMFGLGYGYPLGRLNSAVVEKQQTRSPHSIFYFALAYSGCLGVAIFFWLQGSMFALLWRSFKLTGGVYALAFYTSQLFGAFFGNFIETPGGGISVYLIAGLLIGPMFLQLELDRRAAQDARLFSSESWPEREAVLVDSVHSKALINESTY
jgi:O-Antigen ligase